MEVVQKRRKSQSMSAKAAEDCRTPRRWRAVQGGGAHINEIERGARVKDNLFGAVNPG